MYFPEVHTNTCMVACTCTWMHVHARSHTHKDKILSEIDMIVCDSSLTSYNTYDNNNMYLRSASNCTWSVGVIICSSITLLFHHSSVYCLNLVSYELITGNIW